MSGPYIILTYKELRSSISNKGLAIFTLAYTPIFMLFFGLFVYPYLGSARVLADMYQYGVLFVVTYSILISSFMIMGLNIVTDTLHGTMIKLATMPIDRRVEALGRLTANLLVALLMGAGGALALALAAFLRGIAPLPSPLRLPPPVLASIPPFYLAATGMALPAAALARGRIQIYNTVAVGAINLFPFLSGMFVPLFMLPEWLQRLNQFNPFAIPFCLYLIATSDYNAPLGNGGLLSVSYLVSTAVFLIGLRIYRDALRGGVR